MEDFEIIREKLSQLECEDDKEKMKKLIISIIVDLEKFCHRDNIQIHGVLAEARAKCKEEIHKPY